MNPEQNQHVRVYFRNGLVREGLVLSWSDKKAVLKALSNDNKLIIQSVLQDILAVEIFEYKYLEEKTQPVYIDKELELEKPERNQNIRALKLAELRILRGREERERARQTLTSFKLDNAQQGMVQYGVPRGSLKPPNFDTSQKNRTRNPKHHR